MFRRSLLALVTLIFVSVASADDLDDGIGFDKGVNDDITLGKNVQFIRRKAIAKSKKGDSQQGGGCGTGNVIIGPGSRVKEVYNLSTNKGTTSVCQ
ncbi:MAG: hypothetical protein RQ715_01205 [Methylococcales bacterium]|nr:hypothetical protein [Methylococcales bacterium]